LIRKPLAADYPELVATHRKFEPGEMKKVDGTGNWENFEAPQDVCATAYLYQVLPSADLPPIDPFADRIKDLGLKKQADGYRIPSDWSKPSALSRQLSDG
jgi:hypothetical protein